MLDDELIIETPERVELHYVLANVGNRFLAAAIDHIIQIVVLTALLLGAAWLTRWGFFSRMNSWIAAGSVLGVFALYWGYFVVFETFWSGQTPGKRIMKLRVVREDGRPVRFFEVFVRNILRLAIDFMPLPSYAIGVASIIFSARSKRIGDFVAGTVVVKERATEAPSLDDIVRIAEIERLKDEQAVAVTLKADIRRLSVKELRALETFLMRRFELQEPNRSILAVRIAASISEKLGITRPELQPETLLEEIHRQHNLQSRYGDGS
ncbi:MAG: hypothetical protein DMF61_19375 [Blastocatellia bacterium AA13]|nr:MAG: hypothetical protein DMF61_19375 [Blastocatellia bacterium AA13]